jgi:hypothetical protein
VLLLLLLGVAAAAAAAAVAASPERLALGPRQAGLALAGATPPCRACWPARPCPDSRHGGRGQRAREGVHNVCGWHAHFGAEATRAHTLSCCLPPFLAHSGAHTRALLLRLDSSGRACTRHTRTGRSAQEGRFACWGVGQTLLPPLRRRRTCCCPSLAALCICSILCFKANERVGDSNWGTDGAAQPCR